MQMTIILLLVHMLQPYSQYTSAKITRNFLISVLRLCFTAESVSRIMRMIKCCICARCIGISIIIPSVAGPILQRALSCIRFYRDNAMFTVVKRFTHIDSHCVALRINISQCLSRSAFEFIKIQIPFCFRVTTFEK